MDTFGRYTLLKRLGAGGMGEVFLAKAANEAQPIVLKRILPHLLENPRFLRLFLDETRIASRLVHPNIARIHELGEASGTWYVAMEHVPGKDLRELIKRAREMGDQVPVGVVLKIGIEVARGLHHAHDARDAQGRSLKIVHRDVSPHNVLISRTGDVKLIDFGVAKAANKSMHTATGILKGKFPYMAPEQASARPVDARTDVFALGIVLWETLCGRYLFRGKSDAATVKQVRAAEVQAPSELRPDVPDGLDRVFLKALRREPKDRYQSAQAFGEALEQVLAGLDAPDLRGWFERYEDVAGLDESAEDEVSDDDGTAADEQQARTEAGVPGQVPREVAILTRAERSRGSGSQPGLRAEGTAGEAQKILSQLNGSGATNLGRQPTSFVGRVAELADLHTLFRQGARIVTLLGPGGTGKTRLSQQFAEQLVSHFRGVAESGRRRGGVWFCDLTEANDVDGICSAVARGLSVPLAPGDAVQQLGHALLARGELMLVLDNFEQVVAHAPETVERWLRVAPEARFVVSSRELLRVTNETVFEVPPLRTPKEKDEVRASEAVQLFVERARAARPRWEPNAADEEAMAEIVRQLDGMPLAIELAAARMAVLSPAQLVQRLPRRFELLVGGKGVSDRQATLRGAIDWSWQNLAPPEASALAQLSVFRGGFAAEAVDAVVNLSAWPDASPALETLVLLRSKSLVRAYFPHGEDGHPRFGLYESIREYAWEKLGELPELAGALERHSAFYLQLGGALSTGAEGRASQLDALDLERDNLNITFQRAMATGAPGTTALQAALALDPLLTLRGPFKPHPLMLEGALERVPADAPMRALGLEARGRVRQARGRSAEAEADFLEAQALASARHDVPLEGRLESYLGGLHRTKGQHAEAHRRFARALALLRSVRDRRMEGRTLSSLAVLLHEQGREAETLDAYNEALEIHRQVGDRRYEGITLANLGVQQQSLGLLKQARANYQAALAIHRELGNRRSEGISHINLGDLGRDLGQPGQALAHYESALNILREAGARRFEGVALTSLASLHQERDELGKAADAYRRAAEVLQEVGEKKYEGLARAGWGAIEAVEGRLDNAAEQFAVATELLTRIGDTSFLDALDVFRAHLELAQAAAATTDAERDALLAQYEKRLDRAERAGPPDAAHPGGTPSPADRSEHVRAALRSLEVACDRLFGAR